MYVVRIYGDHPEAGPGALLEEHEYATDVVRMLEVMAGALGDGCAVTLEASASTVYSMDTAERYPLSMARDLLTRQWGRETAAKTLFDARFTGPVTIGATCVAWAGNGYTITDD